MADATHGTAPFLSFDSLESPGEEGFWLWRDQMSPVFDITLPKEEVGAFRGTLQTYHLGGVLLGRCASVTQTFHRTPQVITRSGIDHYLIQVQRRGGSCGTMGRRDVQVGPGDVCVLDLAQTVHTVDTDMDTLTLCLPREMLAPLVSAPDALHGMVLRGDTPLGALLSGHIQSLYRAADALSAREALILTKGSAAFVAGCLGPTVDALDLVRPQMQASRMAAIKRHIDARLGDPDFGAAQVAEAFGLSRPTLYRLFEPLGGVSAYILRRRLDRCLGELTAAHGGLRIAEIAHRWGFRSEAAFSRAFRSAFGMTPRDARNNKQRPRSLAAGSADALKRWFHELAVF
ncbi:helix-turn-helix domain-containing protein [Azospirillum brasilense]|uniref:helix-turn-helix domain-containing protein n=1 Tax=Azospirillum brasilense TaxID=192 RepID=UPI000E0C89BC|nr:helix-turn-helix domain-containing protein [Azospirillum brasilense]